MLQANQPTNALTSFPTIQISTRLDQLRKINGRPDRPSIMLYVAVVPQGQPIDHAFAS
jgi:hypothetical protein